jgi:hypothetical protein
VTFGGHAKQRENDAGNGCRRVRPHVRALASPNRYTMFGCPNKNTCDDQMCKAKIIVIFITYNYVFSSLNFSY